MRPCRSPSTAVRKSSDLRKKQRGEARPTQAPRRADGGGEGTTCRRGWRGHDVQTGVERARRADGGGEGTTCRRGWRGHDVQTGVERARRADGGGEGTTCRRGWRGHDVQTGVERVGGGGGLRGLIRRADVLRPSRCGCLLSSACLPSLPVGGVAGACGRAAPVAGSACACCARRR